MLNTGPDAKGNKGKTLTDCLKGHLSQVAQKGLGASPRNPESGVATNKERLLATSTSW